ncbi:MAG: class I SAM-dependent methyltransferase, partial [Vicinamibacterales bacterium]
MGFVRANTIPLLKEHKRKPFAGPVLCLGAPDVYFTWQSLLGMAATVGATLDLTVPVVPSPRPDFQGTNYIDGRTLLGSLGFESIEVLDVSAFEGAGIIHDLNSESVPADLHGRFDLIIDHGTLEHVFHVPNALRALFTMLKVGGRLVHSSPTSNLVDHGFYMF